MGTCCAADEKNNRHNPYIYDPRRNPINSQSGSNHYIQSSAQSYPGNHPHSPNQNQYPPGYNSQNNGPYPPQYRPQQGANMYPPRNPQIQQPNYPPNNGFQNPFVNQSAHQPHQPNYVDNQGVRRMNTLPDNQNYNPYPNQQMVPPEQISNTLIGMFKKNDGNQPYL